MDKEKISVLVLNGPNLHLLGIREPDIYGEETQQDILEQLNYFAKNSLSQYDITISMGQSNHEGQLIDWITQDIGKYDGILINPAAFTHTSVAISDAIRAIPMPTVEVHLTNVFAREEYRHNMITTPSCVGQVCGFGSYSYILGLVALIQTISNNRKTQNDRQ